MMEGTPRQTVSSRRGTSAHADEVDDDDDAAVLENDDGGDMNDIEVISTSVYCSRVGVIMGRSTTSSSWFMLHAFRVGENSDSRVAWIFGLR
jgi:hypothetical protein